MAKPFDLVANEWWQIPRVGNSRLGDVYATNPGGTQASIMSTWNGGVIDTNRGDLVIPACGGHIDYRGNEVYAFNFASGQSLGTLVWRRKCNPSVAINDNSEANADGSMASIHTYSCIGFDAVRDRIVFGAGGQTAGPNGSGAAHAWEFDASTETPNATAPSAWTMKDAAPVTPQPNLAFDPNRRYFFGLYDNSLVRFDPAASPGSQYATLTTFDANNAGFVNCAIAPISPSQIFYPSTTDSGEMFGKRLASPYANIGSASTGLPASGDIAILDVAAPGMEWEPELQQFVMWGGTATGGTDNRDTYLFDPLTNVITRVAGSGDTPSNPQTNGTFGRFRSLAGCGTAWIGLYILFNTTTGDGYFYRAANPRAASVNPLRVASSGMRW